MKHAGSPLRVCVLRNRSHLARIAIGLIALVAVPGWAQVNLLLNGRFEIGDTSQGWFGVSNWSSTTQAGGAVVSNGAAAYDGYRYLQVNAFSATTYVLQQRWPAQAGKAYKTDGFVMSPAGPNYFAPTSGYCALMMQFYDATGAKIGGNVQAPFIRSGAPTAWTQISTLPSLAPPGTVTGRTMILYVGSGDRTTSGYVHVDQVRSYETQRTTAGALLNPDFETLPISCCDLQDIPDWTGLGNAGGVVADTNATPGGSYALAIWWHLNFVGQTWPATPGVRYASGAKLMTPVSNPLTTTSDARGIVINEYLDATGTNVLLSYLSSPFLAAATNRGQWVYLEAEGVAPPGTVYGRTLLGILGSNITGGVVYFDDATQRVVASTSTSCGLVSNPGFEDGPPGDARALTDGNLLGGWQWPGSTNSGFVQGDYRRSGTQAASITWYENLLVQPFLAQTGMSYVLSGYMFNPANSPANTNIEFRGTSHGSLLIEFLDPVVSVTNITTNALMQVVTNIAPKSISATETPWFTAASPNDTWIYVCVTARAPASVTGGGALTGRVAAAILGADSHFAGALFFDDICVTATNIAYTPQAPCGAVHNPGFEDSPAGTALEFIPNWTAFGNAGGVQSAHARSGGNALQLYFRENLLGQTWSATAGHRYQTEAHIYTPSSNPLRGEAGTNFPLQALTILQFLDSSGTNVLVSYPSEAFLAADAAGVADTWILQTANGLAPQNAAYGRTLVGIVGGETATYGGEVWYDDVCQEDLGIVETSCGLLTNPGFDDGMPGNAWSLDPASNTNIPPPPDNLPGWTYFGGDNAAYIASDAKRDGYQSLVLTWPLNYMVQDFRATGPQLLTNPGFEQGPAGGGTPVGWSRVSSVGQESWAAETGTNGVAFYADSDGAGGSFAQEVPVNVANGNVFQFSIRGNAGRNFRSFTDEAYIKVEFWKQGEGAARGSALSNIYAQLIFTSGVWSTYTITATNTDPLVDRVKVIVAYGSAEVTGPQPHVLWDNASLLQGPPGGYRYVAEGYLYTPSTARFNTDGSSWGEIALAYYANETNLIPEFSTSSVRFTRFMAPNTWHYFAVTSTVPFGDNLKGRLICVINNSGNPQDDFDLAGVIYFDSLCLSSSLAPPSQSAFEQWQIDNFGSTSGANVGPDGDYDGDGFSNWGEFVAGTDPRSEGSFLEATAANRLGGGNFIITWPSAAGRYYTVRRSTNGVEGVFTVLASGLPATPPENSYTDTVPPAVKSYMYRIGATTNHP